MAKIKTLKTWDKDESKRIPIVPRTHVKAVYDDNGNTLDSLMGVQDEKLSELGSEVVSIGGRASYGINIFSLPSCENTYYDKNGIEKTNTDGVVCTPFIDARFWNGAKCKVNNGSVLKSVVLFDADKNVVGFAGDNTSNNVVEFDVVVPSDAAFFRVWSFVAEDVSVYLDDIALVFDKLNSDNWLGFMQLTSGYINYDGSYVNSEGFVCTDYIAKGLNNSVLMSYSCGSSRQPLAAYDKNKQFIRFYGSRSAEAIEGEHISLDADVYYVRYWSSKPEIVKFKLSESDAENTMKRYIVSANGGDYSTLRDAFDSIPEGDCEIHLADDLYNCSTESPYITKRGWNIIGRGQNQTKIIFDGIEHSSNGQTLDIQGSTNISGVHVISRIVNAEYGHYALHVDKPSLVSLDLTCENCTFETISEVSTQLNNFVVGIGTGTGHNIRFNGCKIITTNNIAGHINPIGCINSHNGSRKGASLISFENCEMVANGVAVRINGLADGDTYGRTLYRMINCKVKGLIACEGQDSFVYDIVNVDCDGLVNLSAVYLTQSTDDVDHRVPSTNSTRNYKILTTVKWGYPVIVNMVSHKWSTEDTNSIVPTAESVSVSTNRIDGITLMNQREANNSVLVQTKGIVALHYDYTVGDDVNVGDYVTLSGKNILRSAAMTNVIYMGVGNVCTFVKLL